MSEISRATSDQADRLFDIMVRATEVDCARSYPPEVIDTWHKGRTAEGMAGVISDHDVYSLRDGDRIRGSIHIDVEASEVVGLFVHPDDQRKGYGADLFRFAKDKIALRPIALKATLNAVPFYAKLGCSKVSIEFVRRHGHDIVVQRMEMI